MLSKVLMTQTSCIAQGKARPKGCESFPFHTHVGIHLLVSVKQPTMRSTLAVATFSTLNLLYPLATIVWRTSLRDAAPSLASCSVGGVRRARECATHGGEKWTIVTTVVPPAISGLRNGTEADVHENERSWALIHLLKQGNTPGCVSKHRNDLLEKKLRQPGPCT